MTTQEINAALGIIKTAYPNFGGMANPDDISALWSSMFADYPADAAMAAVHQYIATNKYPPTIADIRSIITESTTPTVTPGEIWQEAYRLLNSSIPPNAPDKAYEKMSDICREAVLAVGGWYALSMSDEGDPYIRRTFLQAAEARIRCDRERGIPFDRSKINRLVPREPALLISDAHG